MSNVIGLKPTDKRNSSRCSAPPQPPAFHYLLIMVVICQYTIISSVIVIIHVLSRQLKVEIFIIIVPTFQLIRSANRGAILIQPPTLVCFSEDLYQFSNRGDISSIGLILLLSVAPGMGVVPNLCLPPHVYSVVIVAPGYTL